jgi:ABC-type amino acid transport substrate-binding protein
VAVGALRTTDPTATADALTAIQTADRIRIAIRPDHPQFAVSGQPAVGFDADVAAALATRLGVASSIELVDVDTMLDPAAPSTWDVGLPSQNSWSIDPRSFATSEPYYHWPHWVVVRADSTVTDLAQLRDQPVCAVAGDLAVDWVKGTYEPDSSLGSITTQLSTQPSDAECLADLEAGSVSAVVTARMTATDVASRSGIRRLNSGPAPEPRSAVVRRSPATESLLAAVNDALDGLRRDGTLSTLAQNRFGGADLTEP